MFIRIKKQFFEEDIVNRQINTVFSEKLCLSGEKPSFSEKLCLSGEKQCFAEKQCLSSDKHGFPGKTLFIWRKTLFFL